jgi:Spy/CpxP family protein refolding chaperone
VKTELKAYLLMAGIFVLGGVVGAAGAWGYAQHHYAELMRDDAPDVRELRRFGALVRELDLSVEQQEKIRAIMARHAQVRRDAMRAVFDKCGADLARTRSELDAQIRQVLTPAQAQAYDRLVFQRRPFMGMGPEGGPHHGHGFGPPPDR